MKKVIYFLYLTLIISYSCKTKEAPEPEAQEKPKFTAVIGGNPYSLEASRILSTNDPSSDSVVSSSSGSRGYSLDTPDTTSFTFGSTIFKFPTEEGISIYFYNYFNNNSLAYNNEDEGYNLPNYSSFKNIFTTGSRLYYYDFFEARKNGIFVIFRDSTGIQWSTAKLSNGVIIEPNYSNNSFDVLNSYQYPVKTINGHDLEMVRLTFDCKVYNQQGDSLSIENAEFNGLFQGHFTLPN